MHALVPTDSISTEDQQLSTRIGDSPEEMQK